MKHRWIGGLALATALMLGACAPPQQGGQSSDAPSQASGSSAPASTPEASESTAPTPEPYDY